MELSISNKTNGKEEQPQNYYYGIHPKKMLLWGGMASIFMMFAAFTSAYIVKKIGGDWKEFTLPPGFAISTIIIIISSFTIHQAKKAASRDQLKKVTLFLGISILLGLAFLGGQIMSWMEMMLVMGIALSDPTTVSGTFIYLISGVHWLHILGGLLYMIYLFFKSRKGKVNSSNLLGIGNCATYWHFVDILWIYLYAFFLLNNASFMSNISTLFG